MEIYRTEYIYRQIYSTEPQVAITDLFWILTWSPAGHVTLDKLVNLYDSL